MVVVVLNGINAFFIFIVDDVGFLKILALPQ